MIIGLGVDLAEIELWAQALAHPSAAALAGTFTALEREQAAGGPVDQAQRLAARFAAKEAFVKALDGAGWGAPPLRARLDLREVEVRLDPWGRPRLCLHGEARAAAEQAGVRVAHLSLSHERGMALATVILEG